VCRSSGVSRSTTSVPDLAIPVHRDETGVGSSGPEPKDRVPRWSASTATVRWAISHIKPISFMSRPSASALATMRAHPRDDRQAHADGDGGVVRACYGVMELGSIRARAIAKTPNSVSATSPKFQRVRRVDSIEVVRKLMERDSVVPRPGRSSASRFHEQSPPLREKPFLQCGLIPNSSMALQMAVSSGALNTAKQDGRRPLYVIDAPGVLPALFLQRERRLLRRCYEADEGPPKCSLILLRPDLSKEAIK
jgi:hypothetical protein